MQPPFDYLIVGGGSAGCTVARVLAERGQRIGLIEAGPAPPPCRRPADYPRTFGTESDWGLSSEPQTALAGRRIRQPRGRGLGGSTRINAMIWYPPPEGDLRMLARHGGSDWSVEPLRASLQQVTSWVKPEAPRWLSEASQRFLRVDRQAIMRPHPFLRMTDRWGRRSAADLLEPHGPIHRLSGVVDQILFDQDTGDSPSPTNSPSIPRATGVCLRPSRSEPPLRLSSRQGVILAAGSFGSPAILIRSGIGPRASLRACGVAPRILLEDVGQHLADHLIMPCIFAVPPSARFPTRPTARDLARWQVVASGPLSSNLAESGAIYPLHSPDPSAETDHEKVDPRSSATDSSFQVHVTPTHYLLHPDEQAPTAMTLGVNLCRPRSRGHVLVDSSDPFVPPRIDPGYLTSPQDLTDLLAAVRIARELAAQPPLDGWLLGESLPGTQRTSAEATTRAIRRFAQTLYHPVGTCRLSAAGGGVVDPRCRVLGTNGLWIVDASVLAEIPSVNPNATIMMLAHHAASRLIA